MVSPLVQAMTFQNSASPAQSGVAPTDVVGAYKLASDVAEKNYMAKMAQQNAKFGGLAGLGGAGTLAFGPTIAKKLFGSGASTAAGTPTGATDAAAAAGGGVDAAPLASGASLGEAGTFPFASMGGAQAGSLWPALSGGVAEAGAPAAAGTVAADLGGAAAADAGGAAAGGALAGLPEWLLALLPFLA